MLKNYVHCYIFLKFKSTIASWLSGQSLSFHSAALGSDPAVMKVLLSPTSIILPVKWGQVKRGIPCDLNTLL